MTVCSCAGAVAGRADDAVGNASTVADFPTAAAAAAAATAAAAAATAATPVAGRSAGYWVSPSSSDRLSRLRLGVSTCPACRALRSLTGVEVEGSCTREEGSSSPETSAIPPARYCSML